MNIKNIELKKPFTQNNAYDVIPFTQKFQNRKTNYGLKRKIRIVVPFAGSGEWHLKRQRTFWGEGNVLHLDKFELHSYIFAKTHQMAYLRFVHFSIM